MDSLDAAQKYVNARLVDRYRVMVFPVITGKTGQDRIFDAYPDALLEYIPTVLDGPPGS